MNKPKLKRNLIKEPIVYKTPIRKYSNAEELNSLKRDIAALITKLGVLDVIKDPEKAVKLDEALR